jgi:hypothetical protein
LRPRAGADRVDYAAGGEADHAADEGGGHHYDQAERAAECAKQAGGRIAHRGARAGAAHRAHHLAAAPGCRFFNLSVVARRRSGTSGEEHAQNRSGEFHVIKSNALGVLSLTR